LNNLVNAVNYDISGRGVMYYGGSANSYYSAALFHPEDVKAVNLTALVSGSAANAYTVTSTITLSTVVNTQVGAGTNIAELTVSGGYLNYSSEDPISIPLTLLPFCKIITLRDRIALVGTQPIDTSSGKCEVDILPTPTYTSVAAVKAFIEANTPQIVATASPLYSPLVDEYFTSDASYYYYGYAPIGTATTSTGWNVKRVTIAQPNITQWCLSAIVANYATLTYL
jgi:hypothetical protein